MNIFTKTINAFRRTFALLIFDVPARRAGIDRLIEALIKNGQSIEKRSASAAIRPANLDTLSHIIGIERWGQRRLKIALGEPLLPEEYDHYRPELKDWAAIREAFHATRQETISLAKSFRMAGVDPTTRVPHNQFGELTLLGWLQYLNGHASIESRKIS